MSDPEELSEPEAQAESGGQQPSAQELLDQRHTPLDDQEVQYWLSVDRTNQDQSLPESGLVQASYNFVDGKLASGETVTLPSEQELSPYVQQALDVVLAAAKDPEIVRRAIYDASERRPEDIGALRIEEIADYLEAFKEQANGNAAEQELRRASLDIAMGMVTAQFAETHPDAVSHEDEGFRPDVATLASYVQNPENVTRHERTFIEETEARIDDVNNIRRHPAEARTMIAEGLGGSAEPEPDTRTKDERVEDARDKLDQIINDSDEPEPSPGTEPDNVVRLDDYRRSDASDDMDSQTERARPVLDRNGEMEEANKVLAEVAKLDGALAELQGTSRDLEGKGGKLQRKITRAEKAGRNAGSLRQQLDENLAGQKDIARQYGDLSRYRQRRADRYAEMSGRQQRAA